MYFCCEVVSLIRMNFAFTILYMRKILFVNNLNKKIIRILKLSISTYKSNFSITHLADRQNFNLTQFFNESSQFNRMETTWKRSANPILWGWKDFLRKNLNKKLITHLKKCCKNYFTSKILKRRLFRKMVYILAFIFCFANKLYSQLFFNFQNIF